MDDIQTWIYIIIGIIYFIVRSLKKKAPDPSDQPIPKSGGSQPVDTERRRPMTFEELLKEFTDPQGSREEAQETEVLEEEEEPARDRQKEEFIEEGKTRRFSDEESRRVYEESIKKAEGYEIEYNTDNKYHSEKLIAIPHDHEEEEDTLADDIKEMFDDPSDARKAIILSEILNRRY